MLGLLRFMIALQVYESLCELDTSLAHRYYHRVDSPVLPTYSV